MDAGNASTTLDRSLEPDPVRERGDGRQENDREQQKPSAIDGEAEPPHLHGHEERQREDDGASGSPRQANQVPAVLAHAVR